VEFCIYYLTSHTLVQKLLMAAACVVSIFRNISMLSSTDKPSVAIGYRIPLVEMTIRNLKRQA
jgi:hypothetical protein